MHNFIRKYIDVISIFIATAVFFISLLAIRGEQLVKNFSDFNRYNNTEITDIVYSYDKEKENCFANINKSGFLKSEDNHHIDSDIFMLLDEVTYNDNLFYYNNEDLSINECLISKNLAEENNLKIGDYLFLNNKPKVKIIGFLYSQDGLDDKGYHSGVTIIGYDEQYIKHIDKVQYVTFYINGEVFMNVDHRVGVYDEIQTYKKEVSYDFGLMISLYVFIPILVNLLFQFKRYKFFEYSLKIGKKKYKVFLQCICLNFIKYLIPSILSAVFLFFTNCIYYTESIIIGSIYICNTFTISILLSFIDYWRAKGWKMKIN